MNPGGDDVKDNKSGIAVSRSGVWSPHAAETCALAERKHCNAVQCEGDQHAHPLQDRRAAPDHFFFFFLVAFPQTHCCEISLRQTSRENKKIIRA